MKLLMLDVIFGVYGFSPKKVIDCPNCGEKEVEWKESHGPHASGSIMGIKCPKCGAVYDFIAHGTMPL